MGGKVTLFAQKVSSHAHHPQIVKNKIKRRKEEEEEGEGERERKRGDTHRKKGNKRASVFHCNCKGGEIILFAQKVSCHAHHLHGVALMMLGWIACLK